MGSFVWKYENPCESEQKASLQCIENLGGYGLFCLGGVQPFWMYWHSWQKSQKVIHYSNLSCKWQKHELISRDQAVTNYSNFSNNTETEKCEYAIAMRAGFYIWHQDSIYRRYIGEESMDRLKL